MDTNAVTDLGWSTALLGALAAVVGAVVQTISTPAGYVVLVVAFGLVAVSTGCAIVTWRRDDGR